MNNDDMEENDVTVSFAVQRLHEDFSGMGPGNDLPEVTEFYLNKEASYNSISMDEIDVNGINVVQNLSLDTFRGSLIRHFDIQYKRKELVWPKQRKIIPKF